MAISTPGSTVVTLRKPIQRKYLITLVCFNLASSRSFGEAFQAGQDIS